MQQGSPRNRVKGLLKGEWLGTPLLMPIVFGLGARLENLTMREFLANPTKIANALRQIRVTLKLDGICCYFDPWLEIEALGAKLEWTSERAKLLSGTGSMTGLASADQIVRNGRVPVAIEVLKRAKVMLKDNPALLVRVTGPLTLAAHLQPATNAEAPDPELLSRCSEITSALVKAYLDAGADVIFLVEDSLPIDTADLLEFWAGLLDPVINVTRFYEALPVLALNDTHASTAILKLIAARAWDCVLCPSPALAWRLPPEDWRSAAPLWGVAVDVCELRESDRTSAARLRGILEDGKTAFITTDEDISSSVDLKQLAAVLQQLRGVFSTVS